MVRPAPHNLTCMGRLPDLANARQRLGLALEVLRHDRWVLGDLSDGRLDPIASSDLSRQLMQSRPLKPLARRALFEQRPLVVNSVLDEAASGKSYDWELDWPALMYVPVAELGCRPIGLLVLGCRRDHWYSEDDINYAGALGATLTPLVAKIAASLRRLNDSEREVAQLLSHGLSSTEIAKLIKAEECRTHTLVEDVTRKLDPHPSRPEGHDEPPLQGGSTRGLQMTW